ncbi:MAG: type II toxin-antitoxin system RelE/ParE family toxin [Candidatus Peregrinibacteria bacterium]
MISLRMYKIVITEHFKKQLKRLVKKNDSLKEQLKITLLNFDKRIAISIGMGIFKLRLKSITKGKSGGYRLYIFLLEFEKILTPICIYSKNKKENLTSAELAKHLEETKIELELFL